MQHVYSGHELPLHLLTHTADAAKYTGHEDTHTQIQSHFYKHVSHTLTNMLIKRYILCLSFSFALTRGQTHTHTHSFHHKCSPIYYWVYCCHFKASRSLASITLLVATRQPHYPHAHTHTQLVPWWKLSVLPNPHITKSNLCRNKGFSFIQDYVILD